MSLIAISVGGQTVRQYLTFIPQQIFTFIDEKKYIVIAFNFFVVSQLSTYLKSTGAFEVTELNTIVILN